MLLNDFRLLVLYLKEALYCFPLHFKATHCLTSDKCPVTEKKKKSLKIESVLLIKCDISGTI